MKFLGWVKIYRTWFTFLLANIPFCKFLIFSLCQNPNLAIHFFLANHPSDFFFVLFLYALFPPVEAGQQTQGPK